MTLAAAETDRLPIGDALRAGTVGGVLAGLVFAMFEMVVAAFTDGDLFAPLRMIGGIALGERALDPGFSLLLAGATGMIVHMALSALYGAAFAVVLSILPVLAATTGRVLLLASILGAALWIGNFYIAAPVFGWNWFPDMTNPIIQFVAHTFMFGTVLGLLLDRFWLARHRT